MAIAAMQHVQALAQFFAERMLNSLGVGIAIVAFAWLLVRLLGRQSSSTRFAVWLSALIAIAALPLLEGSPLSHNLVVASNVSSALSLPVADATAIFAIWAFIATIGLAKIAVSFLRLQRLRRSCQTIDPEALHPTLQRTLRDFGSRRQVRICTSSKVRVPAAIGFVKPVIVFPSWALEEFDPLELNAVLLHELAHLRRCDDWTNLAQQILRALFFFHPGVWFIGRSLSVEREMACDDFALAETTDRGAYARCLVSVAEKTFLHRGLALSLAIAGRVHQTTQRVARILDVHRPTRTRVWKPALGLIATFSAVCIIALPRTPRLVEFENNKPTSLASVAKRLPNLDLRNTDLPSTALPNGGARVIPAVFHVANPGLAARKNVSLPYAARPSQASATPLTAIAGGQGAKVISARGHAPKLLNAVNRVAAVPAPRPRSLLVVMQTQQIDDSGNVVWSVAVWQLTVFHPVETVRKEITPKTT